MLSDAVVKPFWAKEGKRDEGLDMVIEAINEALRQDPKQSLAEFASKLNASITKANLAAIHRMVMSQFDKE